MDRTHRGGGLVDGFEGFGGIHGVGHNAAAGLHVGAAFPQQGRADRDGHVHVTGEVKVAHHSPVDPAAVRFQLVEQSQRAGFGGAGERPGREGRLQHVVGLGSGRQFADHGGDQVHDVAEALDLHELGDVDGAGHADLGQVVAGEIHQHQVFGAFLFIREELLGQGLVRLHSSAARPGAGDGVGDDFLAGHGHERFRGGPDDRVLPAVGVLEAEDVHVRAGIGVPEHPVDIQRVRAAFHFEAARDDHLEDFAVDDRFLAAVQGGEVVRLIPAFLHAGGEVQGGGVQHGDRLLDGGADLRQQGLDPGDGVMPGLVDPLGAVVEVDRVGNQQHGAVHVVVHRHVGDEVQRHFGQLEIVLGRAGELLPVPDGFPAEEADQAGGERRQAVETVGAEGLDRVTDGVHRAAAQRNADGRFAEPVRLAVLGGQRGP